LKIFLDKQNQAMLILKGNLFDTFPVVLVGNQLIKNWVICLSNGLCSEVCGFLLLYFYLFTVGQAFCEDDPIVQTTMATF
jgi:hypothetical protein